MEDGEWKMENGKWKMARPFPGPAASTSPGKLAPFQDLPPAPLLGGSMENGLAGTPGDGEGMEDGKWKIDRAERAETNGCEDPTALRTAGLAIGG